jgi:hypothetical protein
MRQILAIVLVAFLAMPPAQSGGASLGVIQGAVTLGGHGAAGVEIALIDLASGRVQRVTTAGDGSFSMKTAPGRYAFSTENQAGLLIDKAPTAVSVAAGKVSSAQIALMALPSAAVLPMRAQDAAPQAGAAQPAPAAGDQSGAAPPGQAPPMVGAQIVHDPVGCFIAGQFPLLDGAIEPMAEVARARAYFKGSRGDDYFYVEGASAEGRFSWKLPKPTLAASPITYYLWAATTDLDESRTPEIEAIVVNEPDECPPDRKLAAIGPPGEVTIFSAASGTVMTPAGFAAGGLALTAGTIALFLGGAAATGLTTAITVFNPSTPTPTPEPTAEPTATPTPTPTPELPTPTPTPAPTPEGTPEPTPTPLSPVGP